MNFISIRGISLHDCVRHKNENLRNHFKHFKFMEFAHVTFPIDCEFSDADSNKNKAKLEQWGPKGIQWTGTSTTDCLGTGNKRCS